MKNIPGEKDDLEKGSSLAVVRLGVCFKLEKYLKKSTGLIRYEARSQD